MLIGLTGTRPGFQTKNFSDYRIRDYLSDRFKTILVVYQCAHTPVFIYWFGCIVSVRSTWNIDIPSVKRSTCFHLSVKKTFRQLDFFTSYRYKLDSLVLCWFSGSFDYTIKPYGVGNLSVLNDGHQIFSPRGTNIFRFRVSIIFFKLLCNLEKKPSHCLVLNMCLHRTILYISYRYKLDLVGPVRQNQLQIRLNIHTCASQWCYYIHD